MRPKLSTILHHDEYHAKDGENKYELSYFSFNGRTIKGHYQGPQIRTNTYTYLTTYLIKLNAQCKEYKIRFFLSPPYFT